MLIQKIDPTDTLWLNKEKTENTRKNYFCNGYNNRFYLHDLVNEIIILKNE